MPHMLHVHKIYCSRTSLFLGRVFKVQTCLLSVEVSGVVCWVHALEAHFLGGLQEAHIYGALIQQHHTCHVINV